MKNKYHIAFFVTLLLLLQSCGTDAAPPSKVESLFLVIVGTEKQETSIISKYQELGKKYSKIELISTNDCINLKPDLVLLVAQRASTKADAEAILQEAKKHVADSYVRECKVKPAALLARGISLVHDSILVLDNDALSNWVYSDVVTETVDLEHEMFLLVERSFNSELVDFGDGRQSTLRWMKNGVEPVQVLDQCWDFSLTNQQESFVVFQCMTAMAADNYIYTSYVFDTNKKHIIFKKEYCQDGVLKDEAHLVCQAQSVNEFGELNLEHKQFSVMP